jgi:hypothetical protein
MANKLNTRIGHCTVQFGGVDLGHTKDGVEFEFERESEDLVVDQYGSMPVDIALTGQNLTVKVYLAEVIASNLNIANPEGDHDLGSSGERVGFGTDAGYLLSQDAKQLVLHPAKNAAADDSEDIVVYKAVSVESVALNYKIDEQRIVEVTFRALVDETNGNGRRLGHIGPANIS